MKAGDVLLKKALLITALLFMLLIVQNKVALAEDILDTAEIFKRVNPSVLALELYDEYGNLVGKGSAFLIDDKGKAATNYHVIENAYSIRAKLTSGNLVNVTHITYVNKENDVAIIMLEGGTGFPPPVQLGDSNNLVTGQKVFTIGNPLGLENTMSEGIISTVSRKIDTQTFIQITAPISDGSSGGVLLDGRGRAIGITAAYYINGQNLNFAVPISEVIKGLAVNDPKTSLNIYQKIVKDLKYTGEYYYFFYSSNWIPVFDGNDNTLFLVNADNKLSTIILSQEDMENETEFQNKIKSLLEELPKTLLYDKLAINKNDQPVQINGNTFYKINVSGEINGKGLRQDVWLTYKDKKMLMLLYSSQSDVYLTDEAQLKKILSTLVLRNLNDANSLSIIRKTLCSLVINNTPQSETDRFTTASQRITCYAALSDGVSDTVTTRWYYCENNQRQLIKTDENTGNHADIFWCWISNEDFVSKPGKWECEISVRNVKESLFFTVESVIQVKINNIGVSYGAPPILEDGRVLVPFRGIASSLGANVEWNETERKVTLTLNEKKVELVIGSDTAVTNSGIIKLAVPAKIINGSTYVPLRFVGESMGAKIDWDAEKRIVSIST